MFTNYTVITENSAMDINSWVALNDWLILVGP